MKKYRDLDLKKIMDGHGLDFAHYTFLPGQCTCCYGPLDFPEEYWKEGRKPVRIKHRGYSDYQMADGSPFSYGNLKYILFKNGANTGPIYGSGCVTGDDEIRRTVYVAYSDSLDAKEVEGICRALAGQLDGDYVVKVPEDHLTCICISTRDYELEQESLRADGAIPETKLEVRREETPGGADLVWEVSLWRLARQLACGFAGDGTLPDEARHTGSIHPYELETPSGRIYQVDDLRRVDYGEGWYPEHVYRDQDGFRVSASIWFHPCGRSSWHLCVATKEVFKWRRKTTKYQKMSKARCRHIARTFTASLKGSFASEEEFARAAHAVEASRG